ncbi:MAG TPA: sigma-54 dependent transcriptional regulator, partial [Vicinamibacterales bacterium]
MADILVVDDDSAIATAFQRFLSQEQHEVRIAQNVRAAFDLIAERCPDVVLMDVWMPGVDGIQALHEMRARFPGVSVVMMTGYGTSQTSIDAIRSGAFDYLTKPLELAELRRVVNKALAARQVSPAADFGGAEWSMDAPATLVGTSPAMLEVYKLIGRLALNDVPALITGERGTGKQLVGETIHANSSRKDRPFAALDCATLTESAIAEIFDEGTGTLLLANVEVMPAPLQSRVVRALGEAGRAATGLRISARVLASTERELSDYVGQGTFNRELYEILSMITIRMPPLRERRDDIPQLVSHLIQRFNVELNRSIKGVDPSVAAQLRDHPWTGNVRELESVVRRACILARSDVITADDLGPTVTRGTLPPQHEAESALRMAATAALHDRLLARKEGTDSSVFHDLVNMVETTLVNEALAMTNGNQVKASE